MFIEIKKVSQEILRNKPVQFILLALTIITLVSCEDEPTNKKDSFDPRTLDNITTFHFNGITPDGVPAVWESQTFNNDK